MVEKFYNNIFLVLYRKNPALFSIFLVAGGYLFFNVTDAIVKGFTDRYTFADILFWNSFFTLLSTLFFCHLVGFKKIWSTKKLGWHGVRGVLTLGTCIAGLFALKDLTLANFYAIVFLSPIICVVFGKIFFNDDVTMKKFAAVILGFSGILIVTQPGAMTFSLGLLAAFSLAITLAGSIMAVRKIGKDEPKLLLSLLNGIILTAGALIFALCTDGITIPPLQDILVFALIGTLAAIGSTSVSTGFQISPSLSTVAPFHYIQIIGGVVLGYIFWNDVPSLTTIVGASIVIGSGLWIIFMEKGSVSPVAMSLEEILKQHSVGGRPPIGRDAIPEAFWNELSDDQKKQLTQHFERAQKQYRIHEMPA